MSTPAGGRKALEAVSSREMSERAACRYMDFSRRVMGYELRQPAKDKALGERLLESTQQLPRFGYRRTAASRDVRLCRMRRLCKQLALQLPRRRPRRRRCACDIRIPGATRPNSGLRYDFVHDRFADARAF